MDEDEWLADRFEQHGPAYGGLPIGCSGRSPRRMTPSRTPGHPSR